MVARITTPSSLHKTLNYNEQKVRQGKAVCISESGFLLPLHKLNFYDKKEFFENRNRLNERAETKTLHVSLNFSNQEHLDREKLLAIAEDYMQRIGFGEQPYLVYHHSDAGHPHIHILSTTIRADGSRIPTHYLGRDKSEPARKMIEEKYHLVRAEKQSPDLKQIIPFDLKKVEYGKSETRRGIANVLHGVIGTYNYTSLPELNAVLRQFNVVADRGNEDSFIYRKRGLTYRVIDANGNKIGVPIKASALPGQPTLQNLEKKFEKNMSTRDPLRAVLKEKIDQVLLRSPDTIAELANQLLRLNVKVVARVNEEGQMYGITFVDNGHRSVFNGSAIGREYSVAGLLKQLQSGATVKSAGLHQATGKGFIEFNGLSALADVMKPEYDYNVTPYELRKRKRKKKR